MPPWSWRRWRRPLLALACAVAIGCFAFVLRFNSLSGSLGGFTNDQFVPLMRVEMLLRGEQPIRDFADAELRGAWPALTYLSSTWAQQLGGRTLLPEAYLTVGAIALAHALVFLVTLDATGRWSLAWLSAALCLATAPRLYSYPKVLMLVVGIAALRAVTRDPSGRRLWLAALATGVTFLFRHDCGGYVAIGITAGLVARDAGHWRAVGRRVGAYLGATALCLLPSAIWVQVYEGMFNYIRNNLVVAGLEAGRTELDLSDMTLSALVQGSRLDVLTYYGLWATVIAAALSLAWRLCGLSQPQLSREERGFAVGALALAAVTNQFLLRDPLVARLSDAVAPVAVLGAWSIAASREIHGPIERRLVTVPLWCLLLFMIGASWVFMGVTRTLTDSGLANSPRFVAAQFERVRNNLMRLPPTDWSGIDARGSMEAARYVAECTSPDDYLFIAGDAPEITVFARRRFAAGQGVVAKVWYASEADQRRALARLASQSVPIILADARLFASDFVFAYQLLARHVEEHYREVGTIADESRPLIVFVDKRRQPVRIDPRLGFPCFA
jgi:hypothetical protein